MRSSPAIFGTGGGLGTARAQNHFRVIAHALDMPMVGKPEIFVANAATKFDADLKLTDETARGLITQILVALRDLARK